MIDHRRKCMCANLITTFCLELRREESERSGAQISPLTLDDKTSYSILPDSRRNKKTYLLRLREENDVTITRYVLTILDSAPEI